MDLIKQLVMAYKEKEPSERSDTNHSLGLLLNSRISQKPYKTTFECLVVFFSLNQKTKKTLFA